MRKLIAFVGMVMLSVFWPGGTPAVAQSTPPSAIFSPLKNPSKSPYLHIFSCYDTSTGDLLNCQVRDQLAGLVPPPTDAANTGGHLNHSKPAPLTDGNAGAHGFECVACPDYNTEDLLMVETVTNSTVAVILHQVPQFAGRLQVKVSIIPPSGWSCLTDCNFDFVEEIAVDGLSELLFPGPDGSYINSRQPVPDPLHPKGSSGTRKAITGTAAIAQGYLKKNGVGLRINDISLPGGGKFDIHGAYNEADDHQAHRRGQDVDIGLTDIGGKSIQCTTNKDLQQLARANGVIFYLCEGPGKAYHIQFN
jgi:hypothetical protein